MNKIIDYVLPMGAILIMSRAFPSLDFFYYGITIVLLSVFLLYLLSKTTLQTRFDFIKIYFPKGLNHIINLIALYGFWAMLTTIWSPFPQISIARSIYFFFISISPAILGYYWSNHNRNDLFGYLLPSNIFIVLTSLISLLTSNPPDAWSGGHGLGFMGYTWHQNMLAAAIVFTIPSVLYPMLQVFVLRSGKYRGFVYPTNTWFAFHIILLLLNFYLLIISVSRTGVLTLLIMVVVFIIISLSKKESIIFLFVFFSICTILFSSSEAVREFVFKTERKIGDRRIVNIYETIEAAKNGGLIGIGYGVSQPPSNKKVRGHYILDGKMFVREKMISVLALLEETGIIGLCLFITPILIVLLLLMRRFISLLRSSELDKSKLIMERVNIAALFAVLVSYSFHAQIEGWWLGIGSVWFPLFFIILGQAIMISEKLDYKR